MVKLGPQAAPASSRRRRISSREACIGLGRQAGPHLRPDSDQLEQVGPDLSIAWGAAGRSPLRRVTDRAGPRSPGCRGAGRPASAARAGRCRSGTGRARPGGATSRHPRRAVPRGAGLQWPVRFSTSGDRRGRSVRGPERGRHPYTGRYCRIATVFEGRLDLVDALRSRTAGRRRPRPR